MRAKARKPAADMRWADTAGASAGKAWGANTALMGCIQFWTWNAV
jgi:hypothetical protein